MDDTTLRAADTKNSRPFDKRKKRKPKKKKQPPNDHQLVNDDPLPTLQALPDVRMDTESVTKHSLVPMSPRKQTLMRHRKSDATIGEPLFVSEVKELKKNRKPLPAPVDEVEYRKFSWDLSNQTVEDKVSLYKCPAARIVVFHEQLEDSATNASSGTLLGHGEFEIFQLHNGDVTYLACGRLFVYPLLPKLKMLRIDKNQFILPLVNPQRYWKIHIDSEDALVISELEAVLKKLVNYTNLSLNGVNGTEGGDGIKGTERIAQTKERKHAEERANGENEDYIQEGLNYQEGANEKGGTNGAAHEVSRNHAVYTLAQPDAKKDPTSAGHFTPFFSHVPELPPSAPVSPSNLNLFVQDNFQLLPVKQPVFSVMPKKMNQSINSSLANFNLAGQSHKSRINGTLKHGLDDLQNVILANPYQKASNGISDRHSDLSSMDSLLDEYEENISTTKSINFNISRPPSRAVSVTSSAHPPPVQYQRGKMALFPDRIINLGSHYGTVEEEEEEDDFPTTSLSQYNRTRQNTRSVRSRRSSRSELYTSVSNWMEPGPRTALAHSKSTYSLASKHSTSRQPNLNEIYRSITLNNLSLIASGKDKEHAQKAHTTASKAPITKGLSSPYYSKLLVSEQVNRKKAEVEHRELKNKQDGLSSNEVYQLLSSREQRSEKRSGIGRFFGW